MVAATGVEMEEATEVEVGATGEAMAVETLVPKAADTAMVVLRPTQMVSLQVEAAKTIAGKASHAERRQE
jgi:hypothetical protein